MAAFDSSKRQIVLRHSFARLFSKFAPVYDEKATISLRVEAHKKMGCDRGFPKPARQHE